MPGASSFQRIVNDPPGPISWLSMGTRAWLSQRWPCVWNVWNCSPMAMTFHSTVSPTLARNVGVSPRNARPLMVLKPRCSANATTKRLSGRFSVFL